MRNISFSLTETQFLDGSKDVTRRLGWLKLRPGTHLCGVRKVMGFRPGETVHRLGVIEVVDVRRERLDSITDDDVRREGFPEKSAAWFVDFFCKGMRCLPSTMVTRIEFRRVDEEGDSSFADLNIQSMTAGELAVILAKHPDAYLDFSVEPSLEGNADGRFYAGIRADQSHVLVRHGPHGPVTTVAVLLAVYEAGDLRVVHATDDERHDTMLVDAIAGITTFPVGRENARDLVAKVRRQLSGEVKS